MPRGMSMLRGELCNRVPHAHVYGGRGRCSTCRIRILSDLNDLPPMSAAERAVLERVGGGSAFGLPVSCGRSATSPSRPCFPRTRHRPRSTEIGGRRRRRALPRHHVGRHARFDQARRALPFDTVFVINQFFNAVSRAVVDAGGSPDQVLGDGFLALFGLAGRPEETCRAAIVATAMIAASVERLDDALSHGLLERIRFGIRIHAGLAIAGRRRL
jgi:adenylate cyclase